MLYRPVKISLSILLTLILSHLPAAAATEAAADKMISTSEVVAQMTDQEARTQLGAYLEREDVKKSLAQMGISPNEINERMKNLTLFEMAQLKQEMEQARYGGDILVTVLLVVLIIFLIQRI